jgi:hypothetical protein
MEWMALNNTRETLLFYHTKALSGFNQKDFAEDEFRSKFIKSIVYCVAWIVIFQVFNKDRIFFFNII